VNVQALARPGAGAGALGVQFNGASSQYLSGNGLGSPREGGALYGRDNYANDRLMQLWVRPTLNNSQRQDVISDTFQFGIFISNTGMWGHTYGSDVAPPEVGDDFVTNAPVQFNQWTHIMQRTFDNDGVALYINGVAVSRFNADYEEATQALGGDLNMYVGANSGALGNFFTGQIDDIKLHVAGIFTPQMNPIPVNWGAVNLATENEYIANQNLVTGDVNGDGVVNGDGTGAPGADDVRFFIDHWLDQRVVNNIIIGDLTSRTMMGDLNFDGRTSLADWAILRGAHAAGASLDLGALLGASIPEPTTAWLGSLALAALGGSFRRRHSRP
jgi:hypothetical protein